MGPGVLVREIIRKLPFIGMALPQLGQVKGWPHTECTCHYKKQSGNQCEITWPQLGC